MYKKCSVPKNGHAGALGLISMHIHANFIINWTSSLSSRAFAIKHEMPTLGKCYDIDIPSTLLTKYKADLLCYITTKGRGDRVFHYVFEEQVTDCTWPAFSFPAVKVRAEVQFVHLM